MKTLLIILGVAVVALNLLLWYSKRKGGKTAANQPAGHKNQSEEPFGNAIEFLDSSKAKPLKQSAASELGISVEQLDGMSVKEIEKLAAKKGLI